MLQNYSESINHFDIKSYFHRLLNNVRCECEMCFSGYKMNKISGNLVAGIYGVFRVSHVAECLSRFFFLRIQVQKICFTAAPCCAILFCLCRLKFSLFIFSPINTHILRPHVKIWNLPFVILLKQLSNP